ncbi:tetrahydrofolylpolyglutamate synthase [Amylostereum chailletii]|nr:tetrahydrofolylpolyglutamate synthase [Amylostereum chailletii]
MATRTYQDAIEHLNTLQSNAATLATAKRISEASIPEMVDYLERIGYKQEDLNRLNVLHVTGTKGKGSTCAFADSILRQIKPEWKVGLYTSPHLVAVRERIRINGVPISEEDFAKFFFEVWDRLEANPEMKYTTTSPKPMYFRYVTLVAFHAFLTLKVDATILEVGVGGAYDSTNIVPSPVVTGVSALGIDHTAVLGKTLGEIAWQKGGIYKEGVPAITVNQPDEGMEVLKKRSTERKVIFHIILPKTLLRGLLSGLAGTHQVQNAKLAVQLVQKFLEVTESSRPDIPLSPAFVRGLEATRWPGRCQTVADPKFPGTTWFLDGAHTTESLDCCMQWFVSPDVGLRVAEGSKRPTRVLVFNCTHGRSGTRFLASMLAKAATQIQLHESIEEADALFDRVVFCTNVTYADGHFKGDLTAVSIPEEDLAHLVTQHELASAWASLIPSFPADSIHVLPSVEHATRIVRDLQDQGHSVDVLVTGSLHLVGGMVEVAGLSDVAL